MSLFKKIKIGVALGGGGARGFFHIGVLKGLEKLNLKIDTIAGTSVGAIIGGLYALHLDAGHVEKVIFDVLRKYQKNIDFFSSFKSYMGAPVQNSEERFLEKQFNFVRDFYFWNLRIIKPSIVDSRPFFKLFTEIFRDASFCDCRIPFFAAAVDLLRGEEVYLKEGSLVKAALASSLLPGFFEPLRWEDKLLVDGGVLLPIPISPIKKRGTFVIGVNLESPETHFPEKKSAIDIMSIVDRIRYRKILLDNLKQPDFLVSSDLSYISWADFDRARELVARGEREILAQENQIFDVFKKEKFKRIFLLDKFIGDV